MAAAAKPLAKLPARAPVWLHATEPGLLPALQVLAEQLKALPGAPRTQVTGGAATPGPGDELRAIDAALDAFPAGVLVLAGNALPVPVIDRAKARGLGLMLVDTSDPALEGGWKLLRRTPRPALLKFDEIHARDGVSAGAIGRLVKGAVPVHATGTLAGFGAVPACNAYELDALRESVGARPVWFAQNVPPSEVDAIFLAHSHALRRAHRLLMILEPRDVADGEAFAHRASEVGFITAQRTAEEEIEETTQVYVADLGDDPGLFLRLAPVSYLGGSLSKGAGVPSPVLAAALGSALVFGPQATGEARAFLDRLRMIGAGRQVENAGDLGPAISALLSPEAGAEAALKAWTLASEGAEATQAVVQAITLMLDRRAGAGQ